MDDTQSYNAQLLTMGALVPIFYYTERITQNGRNYVRPFVICLLIGLLIGDIIGKQFISPQVVLFALLCGYILHKVVLPTQQIKDD